MKEFSPEDLLEFHYRELSPEQSLELEQELRRNWPLRQKLEVIQEAAERLDKSIEKPRPQVLKSILQYAGRNEKVTL